MEVTQRLRGEDAVRSLAVREADECLRLLERLAHAVDALLGDRGLDHGRRARVGLVAELQRGAAAPLGIGARELRPRLVGVEKRLDGDAQPTVGRDLREARHGHGAERRPGVGGCDVDELGVALGGLGTAHHHLQRLALRACVHVTVTQCGQQLEPLRIARAAEHVHGGLALLGVVGREVGERLEGLRRLRVARRHSGEPRHEQRQQQQRTRHQAFF